MSLGFRPVLCAAVFSASAHASLLGARSLAFAALGAAPAVDAAIIAAGLAGVAAGAMVRVPARVAAASLLVGAACVSALLAVGIEPQLGLLSMLPPFLARTGVCVALAVVVSPLGALLPALAASGGAPRRVYAADLVGAAAALGAAPWLIPVVGLPPFLTGTLFASGLLALGLPASPAPSSLPTTAGPSPLDLRTPGPEPLLVAMALAAQVGVFEWAIPSALAAATARMEAVWPATVLGALLGGAAGVTFARTGRIDPLVLGGLCGAGALAAVHPVGSALLDWLALVELPVALRLVVAFGVIASVAAAVALPSGIAAAAAIEACGLRRTLLATSCAAAAAALAGVAFIAHGGPLGVAAATTALVAVAAAGRAALRRRAAGLVLAAATLVALAWPHPDGLMTVDLSRTIALGRRPQHTGWVISDAWDASGRTVVHVEDDRTLYRDGKPDASRLGDADTQTLLGVLPLLYAPASERALVVGLGAGTTATWLHDSGGVNAVEVVELSPAVIAAFGSSSGGLHIVEAEARGFLAAGPPAYDVITAEPTNLFVAGMARLWSVEALRSLRRALRSDGVAVLWSHSYLSDDEILATQARSLLAVFDDVHTWSGRTGDVFFVVGRAALRPDVVALERRLGEALPCTLAALGHARAVDLLRRRVFLPLEDGPIETDHHPRLSALAAAALLRGASSTPLPLSPPVTGAERVLEAARSGRLAGRWPEEDRAPTVQETLALLRTEGGRALVRARSPEQPLDDSLTPPWMPAVVGAAELVLAGQPAAHAVAVSIDLLAASTCPTAEGWDIALTLAEITGAESIEGALALAHSVDPGAAQPERRMRRMALARALCEHAGDAACAARYIVPGASRRPVDDR